MKPQQIAINSISTARDAPLPERLEAYAAAGFRHVEFYLGHPKAWLAGGKTVADLRRLLERHGQTCIGGFETTVQCFGDSARRAANHQLNADNARLLAELGGGILVAGTDGPEKPSLEALSTVGRTFAEVAERFPASVKLALEFNWSPLVKSLRSAVAVVDAANHPRVGILFDPAHYHCTSTKFEDLTPQAVARIVHVHVNDMLPKPGEHSHCNDDRVLPGSGRGCLDVPGLIARLEAGGYQGLFSIEMFSQELWALPTAQAAAKMYASMTSLCT